MVDYGTYTGIQHMLFGNTYYIIQVKNGGEMVIIICLLP